MVSDCRSWDEGAYRDSILQEREIESRTIFRTAFAPLPDTAASPDLIVAASSDGSIASFSLSSCLPSLVGGFILTTCWNFCSLLVAEPNCFLQGHDGPAYDVKFYGCGEASLLLSCGDDGRIRGWSWKELSEVEMPSQSQGGHLEPLLDLVTPQHSDSIDGSCFAGHICLFLFSSCLASACRGPWGALSPIPENNAIAVDKQGGSIYVAAGDSCAYCWDVEKGEIKMVFKGHTDYLHCIVACNSSNQIITGSEDGTARIWDCRSGKCVRILEAEKDKRLKKFFPFVSCIALDASESWLACGSGQSLSMWNLPACERVMEISTGSSVQDVVFDDNQVLAVGAEPLLSRYDMNGTTLSQIQCIPRSLFSVSLHPSGVAAVAGYGGLVDVISQFGSHFCTFRCKSL
ncbi:hypothetical protein RJ639_041946 [Escallonia herrerae]|uniref:THO complex subunit 6 n=1 Tax=Escallonia herrerae TaxID=1293975 RepID=A0AA88WQA2_9ASTE|nr:hypothetical protein RJ639_041946 [Escallonia herrerae]